MNAKALPTVLLGVSLGFGVASVALGSWQAAGMALLGVAAATVEMFMRRAVFETRLLEMQGDLKNSLKESNERLDNHEQAYENLNNLVTRMLNKLGMPR